MTLLMNAVQENMSDQDRQASMGPIPQQLLHKYLPTMRSIPSPVAGEVIKVALSAESVVTYDHIFDR